MSVCSLPYLKSIRQNFTEFSVRLHVTCGRGSVLRRQCDAVDTSGFGDDVMFTSPGAEVRSIVISYNGRNRRESKKTEQPTRIIRTILL